MNRTHVNLSLQLLSTGMLLTLFLLALPTHLEAQVGSIPLPYPGWEASDQVEPTVTVSTDFDEGTSRWTYDYVITNGSSAPQPIRSMLLRFNRGVSLVEVPNGWWFSADKENSFTESAAAIEGALFHSKMQNSFTGPFWPPSDHDIQPGSFLSGLAIESSYPPGYARRYVRGYAGEPFPPDPIEDPGAYYAMNPIPHDTVNARRGWTLGPTRYTMVVTGGNRRPATDGFLGFMNLAEKGSLLTDPAPIALEFSLNGETVLEETLEIKLNGVDVTSNFSPGPQDGADLVGVFHLGSSPLVEGKNVLLTSVEGVIPGTGMTAKDTDRITFHVDSTLINSATSSQGLENLPIGEPGLD